MPLLITIVAVFVVALAGYTAAWLLFVSVGNRLTFKQLALRPGMSVLDAGCGSGRLTLPFARRIGPGGEVLGIDIAAERIQRAERRAQAAGVKNVRFERTGAGEGRLAHERFDRAVLCAVLGEIANREAALAEIFQALKPGGILSVTEGFIDPHFQRQEQVLRLARTAGFEKESCAGNRWLFTMNLRKPTTA
ncbi:MAG: class I SAM-dependent methyltransferase [Ktedonobacteraceae bacterium]|nr:class I SAM-dependent methyltransferase [Ktedonobacteraceae bacterium]